MLTKENNISKLPQNDIVINGNEISFALIPNSTNFEFLSTYEYINYTGPWKIKKDGIEYEAQIVDFKINENYDAQYLFKYFKDIVDKNKTESGEILIKEIIKQFKKIVINADIKKLHGDIGEAIFILKCLENGFLNEIQEAIENKTDGNETIDFMFNKCGVEIKTTKLGKNTFEIKQDQIRNDVIVIVFKINYYNSTNPRYLSILDIYDKIKTYQITIPPWLKEKINSYQYSEDVNKNKIDPDEITYCIYDNDYFPDINVTDMKQCNQIIFEMNANVSEQNKDFKQTMQQVI